MMKRMVILVCSVLLSIFCFIQCGSSSSSSGEQLYAKNCGNCHMSNGKGVGTLIPSLITSEYVQTGSLDIACMIRNGILAETANGKFENYKMPSNEALSDVDIANILNYLQDQFNQGKKTYHFKEVKATLEECK